MSLMKEFEEKFGKIVYDDEHRPLFTFRESNNSLLAEDELSRNQN